MHPSSVHRTSVVHTLQTFSPQEPLGQSKPDFTWSLIGMEERKFVQMIQVMWPRWPLCPYIVKTFKKTSSPEPKGQWPRDLVCCIGDLGPKEFVQMITSGWPWLFFTARSNLLPYAFIWKNIHFFRKNVIKSFNGRNLQQMTRVTTVLCWYKSFDPKRLSASARGYIHVLKHEK